MNSPKLGDKVPRAQGKRNKQQQQPPQQIEHSEEEVELSPSQILERVKPDRVTASKPEEDRRRRTIIVEKKNGSFGFTLQSYGIHYKKEQEIEMITYVDYVDYDGAAFRAGMREGDVILSINGHDMEKADHKTLVNFIKNCDSRMRMVVLFEDCVRKVELHMRYIQLQRVLQGKMVELERLCLRERELLQGKWKTHSLPARKKATASTSTDATTPTQSDSNEYNYCRPTVSTEDVARVQHQPQTQQLLLAYQYLDPRYRAYMLQPSTSSSGEYFAGWAVNSSQHQHCRNDSANHHQTIVMKTSCEVPTRHGASKGYHQTNGVAAAGPGLLKWNVLNGINVYKSQERKNGPKSRHFTCEGCMYEKQGGSNKCSKGSGNNHNKNQQQHQQQQQQQQQQSSHSHHLCNPCVQASNQDSSSLEAYDLASPCCDPHCVPSARRRSRHHKEHRNGHKNSSKNQSESKGWKEKGGRASSQPSHPAPSNMAAPQPQPPQPRAHRYFNFGTGLVSQCSLHSCTSSELSCTMPGGAGGESSAASYTTSLSTDTLYWDPPCEGTVATRNPSTKSSSKQGTSSSYHQQHQYPSTSQQPGSFSGYNPAKPAKSWDNLTTKAFGGYGFGYGYLDTTSVKGGAPGKGGHSRTHSTKERLGCCSSFLDESEASEAVIISDVSDSRYNLTGSPYGRQLCSAVPWWGQASPRHDVYCGELVWTWTAPSSLCAADQVDREPAAAPEVCCGSNTFRLES
ncbi:uncharacterized protein ssp6 isoform X3 [Periplaneta americana]|uniref:uncharacterized protein ssp6 isoform X3 n=1 Tax=Periplaneta americana TaxID=6978 RepID=UPI0037E79549